MRGQFRVLLITGSRQVGKSTFLKKKLLADNSEEKGKIILTGSQSYKLLSNAADSLAGRAYFHNDRNIMNQSCFSVFFVAVAGEKAVTINYKFMRKEYTVGIRMKLSAIFFTGCLQILIYTDIFLFS